MSKRHCWLSLLMRRACTRPVGSCSSYGARYAPHQVGLAQGADERAVPRRGCTWGRLPSAASPRVSSEEVLRPQFMSTGTKTLLHSLLSIRLDTLHSFKNGCSLAVQPRELCNRKKGAHSTCIGAAQVRASGTWRRRRSCRRSPTSSSRRTSPRRWCCATSRSSPSRPDCAHDNAGANQDIQCRDFAVKLCQSRVQEDESVGVRHNFPRLLWGHLRGEPVALGEYRVANAAPPLN